MSKLVLISFVFTNLFCFSTTAFAVSLEPGQITSCKNAKSITLTNSGGSGPDRTNANLVIWKQANATTVPITLGPGDNNGFPETGGGSSGYKGKNGNDIVNMGSKHIMGRKSVTLHSQPNFSRGDSIGDISGEVRIGNNGTVTVNVSCN